MNKSCSAWNCLKTKIYMAFRDSWRTKYWRRKMPSVYFCNCGKYFLAFVVQAPWLLTMRCHYKRYSPNVYKNSFHYWDAKIKLNSLRCRVNELQSQGHCLTTILHVVESLNSYIKLSDWLYSDVPCYICLTIGSTCRPCSFAQSVYYSSYANFWYDWNQFEELLLWNSNRKFYLRTTSLKYYLDQLHR